jgi:exodeoxyribonuclease-3
MTLHEREKMDRLINAGFSDTFRLFNEAKGHYSWWPNGFSLEERRLGWRLDYFFVNSFMKPFVTNTEILACYEGSDHCPVIMEMEMPEKLPQENCKALETVRRAGAGSRS